MADVIFDIGMHNGNDTAYYLHKGYNVIAVEANPVLAQNATTRFSEEITQGRLIVLNVGISDKAGDAEFWICDDNSGWSSFDRSIASRNNSKHHAIIVKCICYDDIIREYGIPYYMKIDIEGHDHLCIEALDFQTAPKFISIEMSHEDGDRDLRTLSELGYSEFMCIRQNDLKAIDVHNVDFQNRIRLFTSYTLKIPLLRKIIWRSRYRIPRDGSWKFALGTSGPFGHDLKGEWMNYEQVKAVFSKLQEIDRALGTRGLGEWFDFHARR